MLIATVVATLTGAGGLGGITAAQAQPLQSHEPITITSAAQFDFQHGVTNAPGCGIAANPCSIDGWSIQPSSGQACITIDLSHDTMPPRDYVIQNNRCSGGTDGIVLKSAPNGTVAGNTISGLSGTANNSRNSTGILASDSTPLTISANRLSNIQGSPGTAPGQSGGDAWGIHVIDSPMVEISHNDISLVAGGYGFIAAFGSSGGNGGSGTAVSAEQTEAAPSQAAPISLPVGVNAGTLVGTISSLPLLGPVLSELLKTAHMPCTSSRLTMKSNTISRVYGAVGAVGGLSLTGSGGDGGTGGSATGVVVKGFSHDSPYCDVTLKTNSISWIVGALGAFGAAGVTTGGRGGDGGSGQGVVLANVEEHARVTGNAIFQLYGAYGAAAGWGTFHGGNGGNGGDGIGIRKGHVDVHPDDNVISFFFGGLGGAGGLPDGVLGTPGTAAAVV